MDPSDEHAASAGRRPTPGAAPVPELTDVVGRVWGQMSRPWPLRQPLLSGQQYTAAVSQALRAPIGLPRQALTDVLGNDEGLARLWTAMHRFGWRPAQRGSGWGRGTRAGGCAGRDSAVRARRG